ncbi:zeta toxin family protein [Microbacterium sp. LWS13-1.2]|uniref:UDP-N-acetylglucosamine kinase n=1 Tax=Microbacterium sp. LWS13-1.2 TaxID=3135264 RepID=A0AAU6SFU6_9MICO
MSGWELDDDDRDEILRHGILPLYFPSVTPSEASPSLILLSGQPGAGRSRATSKLLAEERSDVAVVSNDDMRAFHPRFTQISATSSPEAREGLARTTAGWVRDCIRFARENKRSLLIEGASLDAKVAIGTAERFAAEGFQTRVVVVASRRAESLLSVASLYLRDIHASAPARFVSRDAHDRAFEATRRLVATVEDTASVDRLTILNRNGQTAFDARRPDGSDAFRGAGAALEAAQSGRLSRFDATQWLSELHHVTVFAASRRDLPRGVTDLLVDLHEVALREVIPDLHVPSDGKFTIAIEQKTVASLVALRRSLLREQPVDLAAPVVAPAGPEREGFSR